MGQYLSDELEVFDSHSLSAYPLITETINTRVIKGDTPTIKFEGDNFQYTDAVYLSSDNSNILSDSISSYDGFDGVPLSSYSIISDDVLYVTTPELGDIGNIVVIIQNPSGYVISDIIQVIDIGN